MVRLNKIYTRAGDDGTTGLVDGTRRSKSDLRFEACGSIDETNAAIGLVLLYLDKEDGKTGQGGDDKGRKEDELSRLLRHVQHDLFDLGADIATPTFEKPEKEQDALRIIPAQITKLEEEIDRMNAVLSPLRSFILPGGNDVACYLHLARTIVRRAERVLVALCQREEVNPHALCYVNRLSDVLFVAARVANRGGLDDILWVPGKNR